MTRWGGVSPSQKTVKLGENYGDLPTPTRTGYTFKGWGYAMKLIAGGNASLVDAYTVTSGSSDSDTYFRVNVGYNLTVGNQYTLRFYCTVDPNNSWVFAAQNDGNQRFALKNGYNEATFTATQNTNCYWDDSTRDIAHPFTITDARVEAKTSGEKITFSTEKYITNSTRNTTVGNHTLTAQWSPNNYKIIYYENKNILDGGEFHENKDITQNEWDNYGSGASIVTADGLACAKISGALAATKYIGQMVLSKIKFNTEYIVSIKTKVVSYTAGTTNPYLALYMDGSYNNNGTSTWYSLMGGHSLGQYSGQGWKEVFYHTTSNSTVTSSTATHAKAFVYARDFTGDVYFRDYSIAEATNTSRTVTFDKSPGAASVLSYNGYDFQGYYTQPVGGTKIYNADGSVVKGVSGYTDSNGNWIRSTETKLYGQWKGWAYLPDSAGATFVNTQALQNSSGGRGKRVVQINTTNNASGTARTYKYSWDGSNWSNGASLVEKTSQGDKTLHVRTFPTGGEHYIGYVDTSIVVHLNKLPMPYCIGRTWTGFSGGWYIKFQRKCGGALVWGIGSGTSSTGLKITSWTSYNDDNEHRAGDWNGILINMANTYTVQAYHSCNGYVDSDVAKASATGNNNKDYGGQSTYYRTTDDGQLTT